MTATGWVTEVRDEQTTTHVVGAVTPGALVVTVDAVGGFFANGGALLNDAPVRVLAVDVDAMTLTLDPATPAPAMDDGDPVWALAGSDIAVERVADVTFQVGVESIEALVPTTLWPYLPTGSYDSGPVAVEMELVDRRWRVVALPYQGARFDASVRVTDDEDEVIGGVTDEGDVSARDLDVLGEARVAGARLVIDGTPFSDLYSSLGQGTLAWGENFPAVTLISSQYAVLGVPLALEEARRVDLNLQATVALNSAAGSRWNARIQYVFNADTEPDDVSANYVTIAALRFSSDVGSGQSDTYADTRTVTLDPGYYLFRVAYVTVGTGTMDATGRCLLQLADRGPANDDENQAFKPSDPGTLSTGGSDTTPTPPPQTKTVVYRYDGQWSRSYAGGGGQIAQDNDMFWGNASNGQGNRSTAIGFPDSRIRNDLAKCTVTKVELFLQTTQRPGNQPGTVSIGTHGDSNPSGSWGAVGGKNPDAVRERNWRAGTGRWVDISAAGLDGWRTGSRRGVILTGPTNATDFAFGAIGPGRSGQKPTLRITVER